MRGGMADHKRYDGIRHSFFGKSMNEAVPERMRADFSLDPRLGCGGLNNSLDRAGSYFPSAPSL